MVALIVSARGILQGILLEEHNQSSPHKWEAVRGCALSVLQAT